MSTASGSKYYSGFNPLVIAGCSLWLDAADSNTIYSDASGTILATPGGPVGRWNDKSSNLNFFWQVVNPSERPTYTASGQNGQSVITFTRASNHHLSASTPSNLPGGSNGYSAFLVARTTNASSDQIFLQWGRAGVTAGIRVEIRGFDWLVVSYNTTTNEATNLTSIANTTFVYSGVNNGELTSSASNNYNGTVFTTNPAPTFNLGTPPEGGAIGSPGQGSASRALQGFVAEVILYNRLLTVSERQQLEAYLAWKWGVRTNFPTTHPYYSILPVTRPFLPIDIPNLHAWYDAADRDSVILSGSNVTTWRDKSGRGVNLSQTTAAWRPTYSSANSEIVFDGSVSHFVNATLTVSHNLHTLIAVHNPVDACANRIFAFQTAVGQSINFPFTQGTTLKGYSNTANTSLTLREYSQPNQYNIILANIRSGSQAVFNNGIIQSSSNLTLTGGNSPRLALGAWVQSSTPVQPYNGKIREILIYSSNLSLPQQQQVEGYLARKWGLANPTGSTSFLPTSLSNCQLWIDAADATTITLSGSNITGIRDKSSNAISVSVSSTRPTYTTTPNTNLPAISFGGSSWLRGNFPSTYTGSNFIVFAVASMNSSTASIGRLVSFGNGGLDTATGSTAPLTRQGTLEIRAYRSGGNQAQTAIYAFSTVYLLACEFTGASNFIYYNGMPNPNPASPTSGAFNFSRWGLGYLADYGGTTATNYWNGLLGECIVYFGSLSSNDRWQVNNYLVNKWRLFDLPLAHPMKTMLPATTSFNPRQISDCILWLDAADPTTITLSGANVTQWSDKSGTANHAVTSSRFARLGPTVTSSNSLQFTRVASTSVQMLRTQTGRQTTADVTYIVVAKPSNDATGANFIDLRKATDGLALVTISSNSANFRGSTSALRSFTLSYSTTNFNILTLQAGTNRYAAYLNGVLAGSGTAVLDMPSSDAVYTTIGAFTDLNYGANATSANQILYTQSSEFYEVLMFNSYLSLSQIQQIEGYLAWKWGLQGPTQTIVPFSPTQISGCQLWLDAADTASITLSESNVTQWNDKSGNGRNTTTVYGTPQINTSGFNGLQSVYFGSGAGLTGPITNTGALLTVFVVARLGGSTAGRRVFSLGQANRSDTASVTDVAALTIGNLATQLGWFRNNTNAVVTTIYNTGFIYNLVMNGSTGVIWLNSTSTASTNSSGNFGYSTYGLGVQFDNLGDAVGVYPTLGDGFIAEVLIYNSALSTTDRQTIEGYLANKWGLSSSLPASHPYAARGLASTHPYKKISPI